MPPAVRLGRPGVRGIRPDRRTAPPRPRRPAGRCEGDLPRRQRGGRPGRRLSYLAPRASGRLSSRTSAASCLPTRSGAACLFRTMRPSRRCASGSPADGYRFDSLVESIVTSHQFLNKRGKDDPRQSEARCPSDNKRIRIRAISGNPAMRPQASRIHFPPFQTAQVRPTLAGGRRCR